jgi:uncharacterized small protein (DUF1192 family)
MFSRAGESPDPIINRRKAVPICFGLGLRFRRGRIFLFTCWPQEAWPHLLTSHAVRAIFPLMDLDELFAKKPGDPLVLLLRQDIDPLSVAELHERRALLEGEIARVTAKIQGAVNHKASADALFKR